MIPLFVKRISTCQQAVRLYPHICRQNVTAFTTLIFLASSFIFCSSLLHKMPKFTPRQRKHKHRQREEANVPQGDTNFAEVSASARNDKEARRQNLREELRSQHPKVSSKKQKRLDKYIVCASVKCRAMLTFAGKQTEERREPRTAEETRSGKGRHCRSTEFQGDRERTSRSTETVGVC